MTIATPEAEAWLQTVRDPNGILCVGGSLDGERLRLPDKEAAGHFYACEKSLVAKEGESWEFVRYSLEDRDGVKVWVR